MDALENTENAISMQEALDLVNKLPFPAAVLGDAVKQFGYWFVLTESGWAHTEQQPN
jgi:hypothetical protein